MGLLAAEAASPVQRKLELKRFSGSKEFPRFHE